VNTDCESCTDVSYCNLAPKNNEYEWIESFTLNGITNNSGRNTLAYGFYSDYFDFDLIQNTTYDISLLPGYATTSYPEYFKVFIDFNQDGIFDNNIENVFDAGSTTKTNIDGQITIPQNVLQGYTRMRVIMSYQKAANPCEPNNGDYEDGEYEDYCVYISNGQCARVNSLTIDDIKIDGFNLTWENTGASSFKVKVEDLNNGNIQEFSTSINNIEIDGLKECNQYSVYLESMCGNTVSGKGDIHYLTTKCGSSTNDNESSSFNISSVYFNYDYLKIKYENDESLELDTRIFDLTGKLVFTNYSKWSLEDNFKSFMLPRNIRPGIYVVNFSNFKENKTYKIIKY
jgi:hypothetical protein